MRSIRISFVALAAALAAAPAAAQEEVVLLTASNGLPGDEFAFDLDLEGSTAVVGAHLGDGAVQY